MTNKEIITILEMSNPLRNVPEDMREQRPYSELKEAYNRAIEALENQKTGHWINRHNIYANKTFDTKVCSECQYEYSYDTETGISNANFCPYCGAKMKGENK